MRALSRGASVAGCWMDTGEGGLSPYHVEGGCDIIMQIGTAKYGIRDADQARLSKEGRTVKTLISYGSSWYKWYMRRLAERPANVWFVVRSMLPG